MYIYHVGIAVLLFMEKNVESHLYKKKSVESAWYFSFEREISFTEIFSRFVRHILVNCRL